jgi:hypothetical protein
MNVVIELVRFVSHVFTPSVGIVPTLIVYLIGFAIDVISQVPLGGVRVFSIFGFFFVSFTVNKKWEKKNVKWRV